MTNNAVSLHRVIKANPEKVFRAFADPVAHSTWLPPYGFICTIQQMDFKVGGKFKMTFINFSTGNGHSFGGEYLEIKPNEHIKYSDKFDDPNLPGEMTTSTHPVGLRPLPSSTRKENRSGVVLLAAGV